MFRKPHSLLTVLVLWSNVLPASNALASPSSPQEPVTLRLAEGQQHVIASEGIRSYSEGIPGVVDVRLTRDASQFVLVGLKPGKTTLLFLLQNGLEKHYRITVGEPEAVSEPEHEPENEDRVEERDNIRLDFYFVQLNRSGSSRYGIGWPASLGGDGQLSAIIDLQTGGLEHFTASFASQILPRLDMAEATGWAKVVKHAAVVTTNRKPASYSGGGEVNLRVQGALTADVARIEFGSRIKVRPRYDRDSGRIELQVGADISELTDDQGTGIPGRLTSTLQTVVNMELGQALVLAGLRAHQHARSSNGLPFLSRIPILGGLFGSKARQEQETENLVFVVPTVVEAVGPRARMFVDDALRTFRSFDGDFDEGRVFPEAPHAAKPAQRRRSRAYSSGRSGA